MHIQADSQREWQIELRNLREALLGESMNQFGPFLGKWCEASQVDISDPTIPNIVDFLNYYFKETVSNLRLLLSSITTNRISIAARLGLKG